VRRCRASNSNHATATTLTLWAVFERDTTCMVPPQITPIDTQPIDDHDPDLAQAMRLHRLKWLN
jgi:hypothetical protein